jgi:hypothetical protein
MRMTSMGGTGMGMGMGIRMTTRTCIRMITVIHMTTRIRIVTHMGTITSGMRVVGTPSGRDRGRHRLMCEISGFIEPTSSGRQPIPVAARYAPRYWAKHMNSPPPPVATRPGCVQSRDMCAEFQECW